VTHQTGKFVSQVEHGVVLDVGVVADDDAVDVTTDDGVIPNTGLVTQGHVPQHRRAMGDINSLAERRLFSQERIKLLFGLLLERVHPIGLTDGLGMKTKKPAGV